MRKLLTSSFFRQSAWMLFATLANGALMAAVQAVALRMPQEPVNELGAFVALLDVLALITIPIAGILTVFMQQTVCATTDELRRQLVGTARGIMAVMFVLWLLVALFAALFQGHILESLKIPSALAWWLTLFSGLIALIAPTLVGILQGEQQFLWVGIANILNGIGRFTGVVIAVVWLQKGATGAMSGVLAGNLLTLALVAWMTRWIWTAPSASCDWGAWFRQVVPLTLGIAAPTYMFTQDMLVVQAAFSEDAAAAYAAPRTVGRVLFFLIAPMTMVMFPKIARSAATAEQTNVLAQAVGATALVGIGTAVACTWFPELMLRLLKGNRDYEQTAWLIPWIAWSLLPLALSNLLVNNLLARKRFSAVPWLVLVAVGYGITVRVIPPTYLTVVGTLGLFSIVLFLVCVVFTVRTPRPAKARSPA